MSKATPTMEELKEWAVNRESMRDLGRQLARVGAELPEDTLTIVLKALAEANNKVVELADLQRQLDELERLYLHKAREQGKVLRFTIQTVDRSNDESYIKEQLKLRYELAEQDKQIVALRAGLKIAKPYMEDWIAEYRVLKNCPMVKDLETVNKALTSTAKAGEQIKQEWQIKNLEAIAGVTHNPEQIKSLPDPMQWAMGFDAGKTACFAVLQALIKKGGE